MKTLVFFLLTLLPGIMMGQQSSNNNHKYYVDIGYAGGTNSIGPTAGLSFALGFFINTIGKASSIDVRAKTLYIFSPAREAGAISFNYRVFLTKGFYLGAGFAHNHETPIDKYLKEPIGATMGISNNIIHRSGFNWEAGYDFRSLLKNKWLGIYPVTNISLAHMFLDKEPNPLITITTGFRFGLKKKSAAN